MNRRVIDRSIPVIFEKIKSYESKEKDVRFQEVKIWLMHLGENLNGSYFSREVVEDAIPTLKNTPILAYIEEKDGEKDFSDHRTVLQKNENGEVEVKYLGMAIGVIPESNNAKFEFRLCDDGETREFLTVEGYLWTKFDDPINIMNRDSIKGHSMELADDAEGEFKEDGLFHFSKFSFYGACALGDDVSPAMKNSTIELKFSKDDFKDEIQEKMELFKKYFYAKEGEEQVKTKADIAKMFSLTVQQLTEELRRKLREVKYENVDWYGEKVETYRYSLIDFDEFYVYAVDYKDDYIDVRIPYTKSGDDIIYDFEAKKRIKWTPTDWEEGDEKDTIREFTIKTIMDEGKKLFDHVLNEKAEIEAKLEEKETAVVDMDKTIKKLNESFKLKEKELEEKNKEIEGYKEFKEKYEAEKREEAVDKILVEYAEQLTEEDISNFKDKSKNYESIDDFQKEVKSFVADKIIEQAKSGNKSYFMRMAVNNPTDDNDPNAKYKSIWDKLNSYK